MCREKAARNWEATSPSYTRLSAAGQVGGWWVGVGWGGGGQNAKETAQKVLDMQCGLAEGVAGEGLVMPNIARHASPAAPGWFKAPRARCRLTACMAAPHACAPDSVTVIWLLLAGWPPCKVATWRAPPTAMMHACSAGQGGPR